MKRIRLMGFVVCALFCAAALAQVQPRTPGFIESLTEPGEGLAVASVSPHTGYATFASTPKHGILLPLPATATAEDRAKAFVRTYGYAFGLLNESEVQTMRAASTDELGFEHVRLQQVYLGVPIRGAELQVHMRGPRVMAANGHAIRDLPASVVPKVAPDRAQVAVHRLLQKHRIAEGPGTSYSVPRLEILDRTLISGIGNDRPRLAWFVEVSDFAMDQYVWIDAQTGGVLLDFSQLAEAKNRTVYNSNHISDNLPGTLMRTEGGAATGDTDADNAYLYAGVTYDYYSVYHNRDSYDGAGAELRSSVHYCKDPNCPSYPNAFWNNANLQMVYGDGYASADDVVAHELTHAVTYKTANLLYYMQSGALNESFSDIFGETVDLTDNLGNDTAGVRWELGEDMAGGAIRNMMNPNQFSDPAKMSDSTYFKCYTKAWNANDQGGVHSNSGVPNHAYALMVDGGSYNGKTITGINLTKAGKIEYRALTVYLTSGSGFLDDYNALNQSCADLTGTVGITFADCTQVKNALDAVEMSLPWGCQGAVQAPAKCTSGTVHLTTIEGFENGIGNWEATADPATSSGSWARDTGYANSGAYSAFGSDLAGVSDHRFSMTNAVVIPSGGRLYFDHAYEFENDAFGQYDGGVVEYSTDGGTNWTDAELLIDGGASYDGYIYSGSGDPLATRHAFTGASYGFTGTRLTLATLAGQNVKFRFRIGSDSSVGSLGWSVDNIAVYTCGAATPFTDDPVVAGSTVIKAVHVNELRNRINANRTARGLAAYSFTDTVTATSTLIKAIHISQLRTALAECYTAAGRVTPVYTDPSLSTGMTPKAAHINELRSALVSVESPP